MFTAAAVKARGAMVTVTETSQPKLSTEELQLRPLVSEFVVSFVKAL